MKKLLAFVVFSFVVFSFVVFSLVLLPTVSATSIDVTTSDVMLEAGSYNTTVLKFDLGDYRISNYEEIGKSADHLDEVDMVIDPAFQNGELKNFTAWFMATDRFEGSNSTIDFDFVLDSTDTGNKTENPTTDSLDAEFQTAKQPVVDSLNCEHQTEEIYCEVVDLDENRFRAINDTGDPELLTGEEITVTYDYEMGDQQNITKTVNLLGQKHGIGEGEATISIETDEENWRRGRTIYFYVVDDVTGHQVGGCDVFTEDSDGAEVISEYSENEYLYDFNIPEDYEEGSNEYPVTVRNCESPYDEDTDSKLLQIRDWSYWEMELEEIQEEYIGLGEIEGKVKAEDVSMAEVKIKNGEEVTIESEDIGDDGSFSYNLSEGGNYTIQAVNKNMETDAFNSPKKEVKVLFDRSGDGIPDVRDVCPDVKGEKEHDGCVPKDVNVRITNKEGKSVSELVVGEVYDIELIDENGTTANISTRIDVGPTRVSIENGEGEFRVDEAGTYTIEGGEDSVRYKEFEAEVTAVAGLSNFISGFWWVPIVIILVLLALFALYKLGGRKETMEDLEQEQIDLTPGEE